VDEARAASVSVRVSGITLAAVAARPTERGAAFASLVQTLARLHALPVPERRTASDEPLALARTIWTEQARRPGFPAWAIALEPRLTEVCAILAADPRAVFSHNDLNPTNVLWDGTRVWLVDWERAGPAHPYVDLATLSNFLDLPDEAGLGLLAGQERAELDGAARRTFLAARDFTRLVYGCVFLRLVPDLAAMPLADRDDTRTLLWCYQQMAAGELAITSPRGQALVGAALLGQCVVSAPRA